jgi:hypothetical protein
MSDIIRDAEFKTSAGEGLWPGMWVHPWGWGCKREKPLLLDACYLWRVEQHKGVLLLAGQGVNVLLQLTHELAKDCILINEPAGDLLAAYPAEWTALRRTGWGVYLHYYTSIYYDPLLRHRLSLDCRRCNVWYHFILPKHLQDQLHQHPAILAAFLATCTWRLQHPKYAKALAGQKPRNFWDWPNVPPVKQLQTLGKAAYRTQEGSIEIAPDGRLKVTGRKAWDFPSLENGEQAD